VFVASLGTVFVSDPRTDTIKITGDDESEVELPGPDLREYLEQLVVKANNGTSDYDQAFERARDRAHESEFRVRSERQAAAEMLAILLSMPAERRLELLDARSSYCTPGLVDLVLASARRAVHQDAQVSLQLAELGGAVARRLDVATYGERRVRDLQAYAWAVQANGLRIAGDLGGARRAFAQARTTLPTNDDPSLESIEIDNLESSLRRDLRDFPGSLELSQRVVEAYESLGMLKPATLALLTRAAIFENMGEPEAAVEVLDGTVHRVEALDDPWVSLMVFHSLVFYLARAARFTAAAALFERIQHLYEAHQRPWVDARKSWAEGLIHDGQGDLGSAERALREARSTFDRHGYPIDAALVSIDLAAVLLAQGRAAEVQEVAAAAYALLEGQGVHPDALAALAQFQQAAAMERLDREVLREIALRLSRAAEFRPLPA
jgi:tetratricopeptide (TPR) repeat protein